MWRESERERVVRLLCAQFCGGRRSYEHKRNWCGSASKGGRRKQELSRMFDDSGLREMRDGGASGDSIE